MAKAKIIEADITDLKFDDKNFNVGSEFGNSLMDKSFSQFKAGRGALVDKNNNIIAGNKSIEKFGELGGKKVIIVETTGDEIVVTKRTDIDLNTPQGREMALADNATAKANIVWAEDVIAEEIGFEVAENWGVFGKDETESEKLGIKKQNLEPFKKTHILLSFHPQLLLKVQDYLQNIISIEGVDYEQSNN